MTIKEVKDFLEKAKEECLKRRECYDCILGNYETGYCLFNGAPEDFDIESILNG